MGKDYVKDTLNVLSKLNLPENEAMKELFLTLAEVREENEKLREALEVFSHPDLCRVLGGNAEKGESIVFQRNEAILRLKDFWKARDILR